MSYISITSTSIKEKNIQNFLKVSAFYGLVFVFWLGLFINNEGPGGVELQHLIMMGIVNTILLGFHGLAIFKP